MRLTALTLLCLAVLMPAPAIAQVGMFERGLLQVQLKKFADAGDLWRAYGDDKSASDEDEEKREAGLAYVLAAIVYQRANDDRAYSAWAKAVETFLRHRTDWRGERERLKRKIAEFDTAVSAAASNGGGGISLSRDEQALLSLNSLLNLTQFEGPRKGLTRRKDSESGQTISVARNYVARPLGLGALSPSQTRDKRGRAVPPGGAPSNEKQVSKLARGFASSDTAETAPAPRSKPKDRQAASPGPAKQKLIIRGSQAYDEPVQTEIKLSGNLKRKIEAGGDDGAEAAIDADTADAGGNNEGGLVSRSGRPRPSKTLSREERQFARTAWRYFVKAYQPNTGLFLPIQGYPFASPWELASGLAGLVSARQLELIDQKKFDEQISLMLRSLRDLPLYNQELPNRGYDTRSGMMVDFYNRPSNKGSGWSAIDIGRLLIWLRITSDWHPEHAEIVKQIVGRWSFERLSKDGEMQGALLDLDQETLWQEGRQGYEQYAAWGFAAWGLDLPGALDLSHSKPDADIAEGFMRDERKPAYLTSDPFFLLRMEIQSDAGRVRHTLDRIGDILYEWQKAISGSQESPVALGEDSIDADPWFLFNVPSKNDGPWTCYNPKGEPSTRCQTLSTKAAFAWSVIYDDEFSAQLRADAASLADPRQGFFAGFYSDGTPNRALSINTNAMILEALAFQIRGRQPFLAIPQLQAANDRTSLVRR